MFHLLTQLTEAANTQPLKRFMLQAQQELPEYDITLTKLDGEALNGQAHAFFTATHEGHVGKFVVSWEVDSEAGDSACAYFGFKSADMGYDYEDLASALNIEELEEFLEAWFDENAE